MVCSKRMVVETVKISKPSKQKWNEITNKCNDATFFHTYEWMKLLEDTFSKYRNDSKLITLDDGKEVLLPLMKTKKLGGAFTCYQSMPLGTYGSFLSNSLISNEQIKEIIQELNIPNLFIIENPFSGIKISCDNKVPMETQILRLGEDKFPMLYKNFRKGHRWSIKKAIKMGVVIDEAKTIHEYKEYFDVYQDSVRRWGRNATSDYPSTLFKNIYKMNSPSIKLYVAKLKDKIISGALLLCHNNHVSWWNGATLEEYFKYYPTNLLQSKLIEISCVLGYSIYDFNPSGGHEGVAKFKSHFGAETEQFNICKFNTSKSYEIYKKMKNV